jgi:hypothetical protein
MKCCLRHFLRPGKNLGIKGVGDCTVCVPDKNNKFCSMYYKIEITHLEFEEEETDAIST